MEEKRASAASEGGSYTQGLPIVERILIQAIHWGTS